MISSSAIRRALKTPLPLDPYLVEVGERDETHAFLAGATQGVYRRLVELLRQYAIEQYGSVEKLRVLDWGAGKGHISYLMKRAGFDITSCDIEADAIDSSFGQQTPIIKEQGLDIVPLTHPWELPFADEGFDIVLSFGVLEHVPNDRESMKEIRRVLRRGGTFFFCFLPYWLSWTQRIAHMRGDFYHPHLYRKRDIARFADEAGFDVGPVWHGQILPKNAFRYSPALEDFDRNLTFRTPLRYLATNIEGFLIAS